MFHSINLLKVAFKSNPPMESKPRVTYRLNDSGSPVNFVEYLPPSESPLLGSHYDPQSMSLRSMLNLGVRLNRVSFGVTENDPNVLRSQAQSFTAQVISNVRSRKFSDTSALVKDDVKVNE